MNNLKIVTIRFMFKQDQTVISGSSWHMLATSDGLVLQYKPTSEAEALTIEIPDTRELVDGYAHILSIQSRFIDEDNQSTTWLVDGFPVFSWHVDLLRDEQESVEDKPHAANGNHRQSNKQSGNQSDKPTSDACSEATHSAASQVIVNTDFGNIQVVDPDITVEIPAPAAKANTDRFSRVDSARLGTMTTGTLAARFRVRGFGQGGVMFAAGSTNAPACAPASKATQSTSAVHIASNDTANDNQEAGSAKDSANTTKGQPERSTAQEYATQLHMRLRCDDNGTHFESYGFDGSLRRTTAPGRLDDGEWHQIIVRSADGATTMWVDGNLRAHDPGESWFNDLSARQYPDGINIIKVAQDLKGARLHGELDSLTFYSEPLSYGQALHLAKVKPLAEQPLFGIGLLGAKNYRIPSLLVVNDTLIAVTDQRVNKPNDAPNYINLVCRRSTDMGKTWGPVQTMVESDPAGGSATDCSMVFDPETRQIFAMYTAFNPGVGQFNDEGGLEGNTSLLRVVTSPDLGVNWSQPINLNPKVKQRNHRFLGAAPGSGTAIPLPNGRTRLAFPVYCSTLKNKRLAAAICYSDDRGVTWLLSETVLPPNQVKHDTATYEPTIAWAKDRLIMMMRNQNPAGQTAIAHSMDHGETWSEISWCSGVPEVFSQPNLIALKSEQKQPDPFSINEADPNSPTLVFCNATALLPYRGWGQVHVSTNYGESFGVGKTIHPSRHVYQSMRELPDGSIGLLWEREWHGVYWTVIPRSWLPTG